MMAGRAWREDRRGGPDLRGLVRPRKRTEEGARPASASVYTSVAKVSLLVGPGERTGEGGSICEG